jgi:hypothetical protein
MNEMTEEQRLHTNHVTVGYICSLLPMLVQNYTYQLGQLTRRWLHRALHTYHQWKRRRDRMLQDINSDDYIDRTSRQQWRHVQMGFVVIAVSIVLFLFILPNYLFFSSAVDQRTPAELCRDRLLQHTDTCGVRVGDVYCLYDFDRADVVYYLGSPVEISPATGSVKQRIQFDKNSYHPHPITLPMHSIVRVIYTSTTGQSRRDSLVIDQPDLAYCLQWINAIGGSR